MEIQILDRTITIEAEYLGTQMQFGSLMHAFDVSVSADGNTETFQYYQGLGHDGSIESEEDFAGILYCIFSDALSYLNAKDIDDFQSEFGYQKVSECLNAYNGCRKEYSQLCCLGFFDDDIPQVLDYLAEHYNV